MLRPITLLICALALPLVAQQGPEPQTDSKVARPKKTAPPRSDQQTEISDKSSESSSSKTYVIDLSPPGGQQVQEKDSSGDITEMKPWNPHRAMKSIEVGDFYFKKKNYRAAESRYREALEYKANDALASFRLAQVLDKTGRGGEAIGYYEAYLKILSEGKYAEECHKAIARLSKSKTAHN